MHIESSIELLDLILICFSFKQVICGLEGARIGIQYETFFAGKFIPNFVIATDNEESVFFSGTVDRSHSSSHWKHCLESF